MYMYINININISININICIYYIYISDSYVCDRVYVYNPEVLRPCRSLSWVSGRRSESAIRVSGSLDISLDSWRSFLETVLYYNPGNSKHCFRGRCHLKAEYRTLKKYPCHEVEMMGEQFTPDPRA